MSLIKFLALSMVMILATPVHAQTAPAPYGTPMSLEMAKKAMAAAEAEAKKNNWQMAIVILDTTGSMVMMQKLDNTQTGSVAVAESKARTALDFRRPTKVLQDGLAAGGAGLRLLTIHGISAIEGGFPVIVDGKVIGAIGVSGGAVEQDAQVAKAGLDAAK